MKPFTVLYSLFAILLAAGCSTPSGPVQLTGDTYLISRSNAAGMFANMATTKTEVIQQANHFAQEQGKRAEAIELHEHIPYAAGFPKFDYTFRLVDPSATNSEPPKIVLTH
jgi:hypothetical protein